MAEMANLGGLCASFHPFTTANHPENLPNPPANSFLRAFVADEHSLKFRLSANQCFE